MKKLYTAREVDELLRGGGTPASIPSDALLTPSARDAIKDWDRKSKQVAQASPPTGKAPIVPDYEYKWEPGKDPSTPAEIAKFFNSPGIVAIKERIVDIGQRIWKMTFVDGNGGNITVRVGDNLALCTPTLISKGFMQVSDICLVDLDGNQLAGERKRTSEALTHFGIMKRQPKAKACVHAHPPHATAYAVAGVVPPTCMIPEAEVFLGQIGYAEYRTPGTPENADIVGEAGVDHMSVLMENHGVICWGKDVEDAYWKMENTDSYCKTIWIASQLGGPLKTITQGQAKELIDLRGMLGMEDKRANWKECELCDNADFHPGVYCALPSQGSAPVNNDTEAAVQQITDLIMERLK
ncbi:MAG: L-fuculose-phosphate aldolase [Candidatus Omnitrophota bacterium]|jgi:L-fuculose-phosphate aldolase